MVAKAVADAATTNIVKQVGLPVIVAIFGIWFVWSNWETINTASRKLDAVDGNIERSKANQEAIRKINIKLINHDDFQGDTQDRLTRLDGTINQNTVWRVAQEKRATVRIEQQKFREDRLKVIESDWKGFKPELVLDQLRRLQERVRRLEGRTAN